MVPHLSGAEEDNDEDEGHGHSQHIDHPQPGTLVCCSHHLVYQPGLEEMGEHSHGMVKIWEPTTTNNQHQLHYKQGMDYICTIGGAVKSSSL